MTSTPTATDRIEAFARTLSTADLERELSELVKAPA